jgi:hypothetical protein
MDGTTYVMKRLDEWEEEHILRVVSKQQVGGLAGQVWQLGLDAGVDDGLVVHVRHQVFPLENHLGARAGGPQVVLQRRGLGGSAGNVHAVFLLDDAGLVLGLAREQRLPPVGDGKYSMHTLEFRSISVAPEKSVDGFFVFGWRWDNQHDILQMP